MNNPDSTTLHFIEDKIGETVTIKSYGVTYGMANYCLLTGKTSGRKFTVMFYQEPLQIVLQKNGAEDYTTKERFSIEKENIKTLSEKQIPLPPILFAGDNFIIWPYLGENLLLNNSLMSASNRLDEIVSGIIDCLAAIHNLPSITIPHRARCNKDNLEFTKNYSFCNIIGNSNNTLAMNIRNSKDYNCICKLINGLSGVNVAESIVKGETYNPETVFCDGSKIHLTDYKFTGIGNPFLDIVYPVSWGLPLDQGEAVLKKQERVRRYLSARRIKDEQDAFFKFDYFTILASLNMMDVLLGTNKNMEHEKAKILFKTAHGNMKHLISDNPNLNEIKDIVLKSLRSFSIN